MATSTIKIPSLSGGISTQPAHMRLGNQTETGTNAYFRVFDGMSLRPGTRYVSMISGLSAGATRVHPIHRDDTEKYVVAYQRVSNAVFKVLTNTGTDCPLFTSGASQAYFDSNSAGSSDYRLKTIADYTLIGNSKVPMAAQTSASYVVSGDARDYEVLISTTPATGTYWRTRETTNSYPSSHFQYQPGGNGYATCRFGRIAVGFDTVAEMQSDALNPGGFSMFFSMGGIAQTGATYTTATKTLTKTGQFANVSAGDWVNITGGTGATAGYYQIESKTSSDTVILTTSAGGSNQTNYTFDGVGKVANVCVDLSAVAMADLHDVAKAFEKAIRQALGGLEACVSWFRDATRGYYIVTSPYAGTSASFPSTNPTRPLPAAYYPTGITAVYDLTATATDPPFDSGSATVTAGTGDAGPTTAPVLERWVRKPAPNQAEALINPATMPQQMVRLNPSGTYTGGYAQFTEDLRPFAWWRLGEATGTIAKDETGSNNGVYVGGPTLAATGALNGDTNTAATFAAGTTYMTALLPGWAPKLGNGFTLECWIKSTTATASTIFSGGKSQTQNSMRIMFSTANGSSNSTGRLFAEVVDNAGLVLSGSVSTATVINDGNFHHLVVAFSPSTNTITFYINGVAQTTTYVSQQTPATFVEIGAISYYGLAVGHYESGFTGINMAGTIDELALYHGVMSTAIALSRYNQGNLSTYSHNPIFAIFATEWTPRLSGDEATNPIPKAIKDGRTLSDIAFFRNRLAFGANESVFTSQDGDFFNLFLYDADNIIDSDPVEKSLSTRQVTIIDHLTESGKSLVITTRAGRQFELSTGANETFTPSSARLKQSTSKQTINGVRPSVLDNFVYLAGKRGDYSALFEYRSEEDAIFSNTTEPSAHVEGLLPTIQTIASCANENLVLVLGTDNTIYPYRFFLRGNEKDQSAWAKWTFNEAHAIKDICTIGTDLFMVCYSGSTFTLERMALAKVAVESGFAYVVNLDRTFNSSAYSGAAFGAGNTTWTIPFTDNTINRVVTAAGVIYTATSSGGTVTVAGADLSAVTVLIGRLYSLSVELSQPFQRDANGNADLNTEVDNRETCFAHNSSGPFTVRAIATGSSDRTVDLTIPSGSLTITGIVKPNLVGRTGNNRIVIESSDPRPINVSAVEMAVDIVRRS